MDITKRKIWGVSDTHFNHAKMIHEFETSSRYGKFANIGEMNQLMIRNWNSVVADEDIVYHLGDVYMGNAANAAELLGQLKGRKRLILGNHDDGKHEVLFRFFEKVMVSRIFKEFNAIMTHIPVHPDSLSPGKYGRNFHGHIHDRKIADPRYICLCVEQTNYFPVDLATL